MSADKQHHRNTDTWLYLGHPLFAKRPCEIELALQAAEGVAKPDSGQADEDMQDDIGRGFEEGAVFEEGQGFESEGGIGGESPEHPNEQKDSDIRAEEGSGFRQSMQKADQETSQDVNRERPDGEA